MATGLERDVEIRSRSGPGSGFQGNHLRMWPAGVGVITFTNDASVSHDDCAHRGIGAGAAPAPMGKLQCPSHELFIEWGAHAILSRDATL